jgi:hypothetical protein
LYPDDASHWIGVYTELLTFKEAMMAAAVQNMAQMSESARKEAKKTDLVILTSERDRFRRRLQFWEARLLELQGSH